MVLHGEPMDVALPCASHERHPPRLQWGCVEPKLLLQKAMNRKMYSKCTSKPCKHKHFVIEPEPVVKSSGASKNAPICMQSGVMKHLIYPSP